ncbi:hypothetical protein, partial [Phascolarctobacterium succinatutens]|uniref:hypothetical protein n=1 Tax=Phascolarctobacterium succinatutens TaxID=626940 RepID=UPI0026EDC494
FSMVFSKPFIKYCLLFSRFVLFYAILISLPEVTTQKPARDSWTLLLKNRLTTVFHCSDVE